MDLTEILNARKHLPALSETIYLNTGTAGPLPDTVIGRMKSVLEEQSRSGRINLAYYQKLDELKEDIRRSISSTISCKPEEITITRSTSEGLNIIINGLDLKPGDEVITSNGEHLTAYSPIYGLKSKGILVKLLDVLEGFPDCIEQLGQLMNTRTRLICLSEIIYCSGDRLPVEEICALAKERNIPVLIDGAQSFGAIPVNVTEMGCDFFAAPGQKWICGPEGTGFLHVKKESRHLVRPLFTGYSSVQKFSFENDLILHDDGRRFESGTFQPADLAGFHEALKWRSTFSLNNSAARSFELCRIFTQNLSRSPKYTFLNHSVTSSLLSFKVKDIPSEQLVEKMFKKGITVRPVPLTDAVRLSIGFFNTEEEVNVTAETILRLVKKWKG